MSRWTHAICDECYETESEKDDALPEKPVRLRYPSKEDCCFCGQQTESGIYIRKDPAQVKCGGSHAD